MAINGYFGTGWRYKGGPRWGQGQETLLLQEGKGVPRAWQSLCDRVVLRSSAPSQELTAQLQPFIPSFLFLGSVPSPQMPAECRSLESLSDCMNQTPPLLVLVLPEEIPECEAQQGSLTHAFTRSSYPMERDALDSGKDSRCTCLVLSKSEIWRGGEGKFESRFCTCFLRQGTCRSFIKWSHKVTTLIVFSPKIYVPLIQS